MPTASILVVDDEPDIRELVSDILRDEGYLVQTAEHAAAARQARRERRPDLILLDVWMPDTDGISLLREWTEQGGLPCPVVMMSGHGTIETAVEATRLGAWDFIEKPIGLAKLLLTIRRALEANRLQQENESFRRQLPFLPAHEPTGSSQVMLALKGQLAKVIPLEAPILFTGEAGTGKETLARYVHARGPRANTPFLRVAASALPAHNAHDALFGREDAQGTHYGLLDQAQNGVLYLDQVGDLDAGTQQQLAAALEAKRFNRVGGKTPIALDVRIIAADTRDLAAATREGRFNQDLLYLLNVLPLQVPALRERLDDIPELLDHYAEFFATRDHLTYRRFGVAAQNRLRQYRWPGNLRELRNLVQRLLILGKTGDVEPSELERTLYEDAPAAPAEAPGAGFQIDYALPLREARDAFERAYLTRLLKQVDGSVGKLAQLAGMERTHLYRKLRDLAIDIKAATREETGVS